MLNKNTLPEIDTNHPVNEKIQLNIPIVSHYNNETLLTRGGELVQIIEITGENISLESYGKNVREVIRKAITKVIKSSKFALYVHTVRSRKNIMQKVSIDNAFTKEVDNEWRSRNNFDKQLVNTVYISVVTQGEAPSIFNLPFNLKAFAFPSIKNKFLKRFEKSNIELNSITQGLLNELHGFSAKLLKIINTESGYFSEPLFFYHQLINLVQKKIPLVNTDFSKYLSCSEINFNFNDIEIDNSESKQYAVLFSIKNYYDLSTKVLDSFTQAGLNFIISESIIFAPWSVVKKEVNDLYQISIMSRKSEINKLSGFDELYNANTKSETDYCYHQITILIHSDEKKFFKEKTKLAIKILNELGITVVREDFNMAKLFWAQLPGNFRYFKKGRISPINIGKIGGFSSMFHHDSGYYQGSIWGPPITLLRSASGTPFYFNFHNSKNNGNTFVLGPNQAGKTILMKFLLTQANKLKPKIVYLDFEGKTKNFIEALDGKCLDILDETSFKVNPFSSNSYFDLDSYKDWLMNAIYPQSIKLPQYHELFKILAENLSKNENIVQKIEVLREMIKTSKDTSLLNGFEEFLGSKIFKTLFDESIDKLDILTENDKPLSIDLSNLTKSTQIFKSFLGVFLNKLTSYFDPNKPNILVITNLSVLFNLPGFSNGAVKWLNDINKKNVILIGCNSNKDNLENNKNYLEFINNFGTKIFLSDKYADKYYKKTYSINDNELNKIKNYAAERRMFLLKQDDISEVLSLNLTQHKNILEVLDT